MWSCSSHQPLDHYCCPLCKGLKEHSSKSTNFDGLFQDIAPSDLLVRVGEYHVLNTNEAHSHIDRKIRKVVTHRNFDKFTYEYDIALLEMHDGPINYQVCLQRRDSSQMSYKPISPAEHDPDMPSCQRQQPCRRGGCSLILVSFLTLSAPAQVGTVTGWGRLSEYGQISPVLREVQLPIISNSKCMRMYR